MHCKKYESWNVEQGSTEFNRSTQVWKKVRKRDYIVRTCFFQYNDLAVKILNKLGEYLKKNFLRIPKEVVLPEDKVKKRVDAGFIWLKLWCWTYPMLKFCFNAFSRDKKFLVQVFFWTLPLTAFVKSIA